MDTIKIFHEQTEAQLALGLLQSQDVKAEIVGAREYSSHVLGGGVGRFELRVAQVDKVRALEILQATDATSTLSLADDEIKKDSRHFFRVAIFQAILGALLFPLVFNYTSLRNGFRFLSSSGKSLTDMILFTLILVLQIPGLIVASIIAKAVLTGNWPSF